MNILIVGLNFFPELTGIGVYTYDFAQHLAKKGHRVSVIATYPYYPQWKREEGYPRKLFTREEIDGIQILRCLTYVPSTPSSLKRIVHEGIFSVLAFLRMLFSGRPDVIIAISPPLPGMFACAVASRMKRTCFHAHIQDLQPDAAFDLGMLRSSFLKKVLYSMEQFCYRSAHLVSAIGEAMIARIRAKGVPEGKLLLFPNWVTGTASKDDTASTRHDDTLSEFINRRFVVLYAGSMGEKQGLDTLIDAAEVAQSEGEDIEFVLVGDGSQRRALEALGQRKSLSNVRFMDVLPQEAFLQLLRRADVSVILQRAEVKDIVVPSKLMNILAIGSPVIAAVSRESEAAKILSRLSVDTIVKPGDPEALYRKIKEFKASRKKVAVLRREERSLARQCFDRDAILKAASERIEAAVRNFHRKSKFSTAR